MTWDVGAPEAPDIDAASLPPSPTAETPQPAPESPEEAPEVSEAMVRAALAAATALVAMTPMAREEIPGHWRATDEELDAMAPPLTRIVNRSPALRTLAAYGDPALLGVELVRYVVRNVDLARRYDREHKKPPLSDRSLEAPAPADRAVGGDGP